MADNGKMFLAVRDSRSCYGGDDEGTFLGGAAGGGDIELYEGATLSLLFEEIKKCADVDLEEIPEIFDFYEAKEIKVSMEIKLTLATEE